MLHAKFHDHRTISSVGEIFEGFLPYMGMTAWTINSPPPLPRRLHVRFGVDWQRGFRKEDV